MAEYTLVIRVEGQDAASAPLQSASGGLAAFGAAADGAAVKGGGFFSNMAAAAGGFLAANVFSKITEGIVGLGASSIQVAQDFEAATATFASVAGGSLAQAGFSLEDVKNKALDMGAQTAFSAAQAQEAMIALAKGGVPIADVMGAATDATLALASAGELGLGPAADIVAKQLGVWGSTGVTAAQVADQLAQAANASTVDVDELALGLANVGGVAKASGISFTDLNQTMAMIAPGFSSAADAGTSLKTMILALQPSTTAAQAAFSKFGLMTFNTQKALSTLSDMGIEPTSTDIGTLSKAMFDASIAAGATEKEAYALIDSMKTSAFYDQAGNFVGMEKAAGMLQGALGGLSEAEQSAALKAMFGTDAFRAASIVVNQGAAGFNAMGDAMTAAGSATEQAAIRSQTFKFAWDSLLGTIETIQIVIGSALLPILTMLVNSALIPAGNAVLTFVQSITSAASPMGALVAMVDSVIPGFASLVSLISANLEPIMAGLGAVLVAVLIPALYSLAAGAVAAAVAFAPVVAAALVAAAPFVALGLAVAGLYAAFQTNFGGIQQIVQPVIDAVVNGFSSGGILGAIQGLIAGLQTVGPQLFAWFQLAGTTIATEVLAWGAAFIGWVAPMIPPALAELGALLAAVGGWIVEQAPALVAQFLAWGQALLDWVAPYIPPALAALAELANSVIGWIGEQVGPLVTKFAEWASALIEWIGPAIPPAIAALSGLADSFFGWIGEQVGPLVDKFMEWASALIEWIVPATVQFLAAWPAMLDGFLTWIGEAVGPLLAKLGEWALAFIGWIAPMIPGFLLALAGIALALGTWIVETVAVIAAKIVVWGGAFLGWVATDVLPKLPGILGGILSAIGGFIGGAISWLGNEAAKLGKGIIDGIVKGLGDIGKIVGDKIKAGLSGLVDTARKVLQVNSPSKVFASEVGSPIPEGIALGISQASPKATSAMLDLATKLVDLIDRGVGAFGKLAQLGTVPRGAVQNFADAIKMSLDVFSGVVAQWDKAAMSAASQFTKKAGDVVEMMSKGVDFLLKLQTLGAIPFSAIHNFATALQSVMNELILISTRDMRINLMAAVEFAVSAGKILESIGKGIDGLTKLGTFTAPASGAFIAFRDAITQAVGYMLQVTSWFAGYPVSSAVAFADSAGKILAMIGAGVDSLKKLVDFAAPSVGAFQAFRDAITQAVGYLVQVAGWFANQPVGAAVSFATSAGQIIDVIGKAVDSLKKLSDFAAPTVAQFVSFRDAMTNAVGYMVQLAGWFASTPLAAAQAFAETAGKMIGFIGTGADSLKKLSDFVAPSTDAIFAFAQTLQSVLLELIRVAGLFETEAVAAAAVFGEAAGKAVGMIGNAVGSFTKLAEFAAPPTDAIFSFAQVLQSVLLELMRVASMFEADAVTAAAAFGEASGKAVQMIGSAVDGFTKLAAFVGVPQAAISAFGVALGATLQSLIDVAGTFAAEAVAAAGTFGTAAGKAVGMIGSAVDGFVKLADFSGVPQQAIDAFGNGLRLALTALIDVAASFDAEAVAAAGVFGGAVGKALGFIGSAVDGFTKLKGMERVAIDSVNAFSFNIVVVVSQLQQLAKVFSVEALTAVGEFAGAIGKAVGGLGSSIDSFKKLDGLERVAIDSVNAFSFNIVVIVNQLRQLAKVFTVDALQAIAVFGDAVRAAVASVGSTIEAFKGLTAVKTDAAGVVGSIGAALGAILKAIQTNMVPAVGALGQQIMVAFGNGLGSQFAQLGVLGNNMMIGLANGIISHTSYVVQAMVYAVQAAINAAQQTLGIASPSKVFKQKIGVQMSAGMAEGVLAGAPQVQSAIAGVSGMALGSASGGGGGGISGPITFNITTQPGQDARAIADEVMVRVRDLSRGRR